MDNNTAIILWNIWVGLALLRMDTPPVFFVTVGFLWLLAGATGL